MRQHTPVSASEHHYYVYFHFCIVHGGFPSVCTKRINLNFLITGHTKFAPCGCFGLLKQAFRRHAVSPLEEFQSVVNGVLASTLLR